MISVIIPCYNSAEYIEDCLRSIEEQSNKAVLNQLEVIIVNDGSKDETEQIIKPFVEKKPELFKYFSIENQGVSKARNYGISQTSSESNWISFLDSDDKVSTNYFEESLKFFSKYETIDLAVCPIYYFGNSQKEHSLNWRFQENVEVVDIEEKPTFIHFNIGGSFVRTALIREERLSFNEKLCFWEDALFLNMVISKSRKYGLISDSQYFYRKEKNESLVNKSWEDVSRYSDLFTEGYLLLFRDSLAKFKQVLPYYQYLVSYHLKLFFIEKNEDQVTTFLTNNQTDFDRLLLETLNHINNDILLNPIENQFNDSYWYLYSKKNKSSNFFLKEEVFIKKNKRIVIEKKKAYEIFVSVYSENEINDILISCIFLFGFKKKIKLKEISRKYGVNDILNFKKVRLKIPKAYLVFLTNIEVTANETVFNRKVGFANYLGGNNFGKK